MTEGQVIGVDDKLQTYSVSHDASVEILGDLEVGHAKLRLVEHTAS